MKAFFKAVALAAIVSFSAVSAPAMAKQQKTDLRKIEEGVNKLILKAYNYKLFAITYEQVYNEDPTEYNRIQALKAAEVAKQAYIDAAIANAALERLQSERDGN